MSLIRILILVVAAGAALVAALMVRNLSAPQPTTLETPQVIVASPEAEPLSTVNILIANRDLVLGERITPDDMSWQPWPEDALNPVFFDDIGSADAMETLAGGVVRSEIFSGEPITARKIVQAGENGFLAAVLTPGMRATAVEISVETAAGGFILPNDRVDVVLTHNMEITRGDFIVEKPVSETVLRNVRVLAIDQTFGSVEDSETILASTATLELPPREVEILALAQQMGTITLSLRSVSDKGVGGIPLTSLTGASATNPGGETIKIYRNNKTVEVPVGGSQ